MRKRIAIPEVSEEPNKSVLIRKAARQRRLNPNKSVLIGKAAGIAAIKCRRVLHLLFVS